jgi:DNA-binding ferritin-like protein (Dps family)
MYIMQKIIIIVIILIFHIESKAQKYFNKQYYYQPTAWLGSTTDIIQEKDSSFIAIMHAVNNQNRDNKLRIVKINNKGKQIWAKEYKANGIDTETGFIQPTFDGNYIIGAIEKKRKDGLLTITTILFKITPQGDSLWLKEYMTTAEWTIAAYGIQAMDKGFIYCGIAVRWKKINDEYIEQPWKAYIFKTDSLGNLLWQKEYGDAQHSTVAQRVIETTNKELIICGRTVSHLSGDDWDIALMCMKLDKDGKQIWQKSYGESGINEAFSQISISKKGDYLLAANWSKNWQPAISGGMLARMDEDGNMKWLKKYQTETGGLEHEGFVELSNGNIVVGGRRISTRDVGIAKFDQEGNFIWHRVYDLNPQSSETINGIRHTLDNGFLLYGHGLPIKPAGQPNGDQAWLLKLDSLGCDSELCAKSVATDDVLPMEDEKNSLSIQPNPNNGIATISWNIADEAIQKGRIEVLDILGQIIQVVDIQQLEGKQVLDILGVAAGMYFLKLKIKEKELIRKFIVIQ